MAIGLSSVAAFSNSVAIGSSAATTAADQVTLGGTGRFATLTWQDGGKGDTVFVPLEDQIEISAGPK